MPDPLSSPGAATSARVTLETELVSETLKVVRVFLVNVEKEALQARGGRTLLAAAADVFTLGGVFRHWGDVVKAVVGRAGRHLGITEDRLAADPFLRGMDTRLRNSALPMVAYENARAVLSDATLEQLSQAEVARRLQTALDTENIYDGIARRVARTEATAIYNFTALQRLAAAGATEKQWVAHHDQITRPTHLQADGDVVPLAQPFVVGGYALQAPGDPHAPLEETANCRCVIVAANERVAGVSTDALSLADGTLVGPSDAPLGDMLGGSNPMFTYNHEYGINCQKAVTAHEMRARKYDVTALPGSGGQLSNGIYRWFTDAGVDVNRFSVQGQGITAYDEAVYQIVRDMPVGARGSLDFGWQRGGAGHIVSWEKKNPTFVEFVDPQTNTILPRTHNMWGRVDGSNMGLLRLDNKDLTAEGAAQITSAHTDPTEVQAAFEALANFAVREEIAAVKLDLEGLESMYARILEGKEKLLKQAPLTDGQKVALRTYNQDLDELIPMLNTRRETIRKLERQL